MPQHKYELYDEGVRTQTAFGSLSVSGQDEHGFRPYFLVTSGVAGCATGVLRRELAARGIEVRDIDVLADVTRIPGEANRISAIDLKFAIQLKTDAAKEKIQEALDAMLNTSSMVQTVKAAIEVRGTFTLE